jgi:hypothetical protein
LNVDFFSLFIYSYVHTLFGPFFLPAPSTLLASRQRKILQFCWRVDISNECWLSSSIFFFWEGGMYKTNLIPFGI